MVRHPAYRTRKYDAKIDPDAIRARFAAHKDTMVEQEEAIFAELAENERKAKIVCETAGVAPNLIPSYLNFARECYRIAKNFSGATKTNEVTVAFNKWVSRGLTGSILANVAELCGTSIAGY